MAAGHAVLSRGDFLVFLNWPNNGEHVSLYILQCFNVNCILGIIAKLFWLCSACQGNSGPDRSRNPDHYKSGYLFDGHGLVHGHERRCVLAFLSSWARGFFVSRTRSSVLAE